MTRRRPTDGGLGDVGDFTDIGDLLKGHAMRHEADRERIHARTLGTTMGLRSAAPMSRATARAEFSARRQSVISTWRTPMTAGFVKAALPAAAVVVAVAGIGLAVHSGTQSGPQRRLTAPAAATGATSRGSTAGTATSPAPSQNASPSPRAIPSAPSSTTGHPSRTTSAGVAPPSPGPTGSGDSIGGFAAASGAVLGGGLPGGGTVTVSTAADLARYAGADQPYVIKVLGVIEVRGQVKVSADKTVIGGYKGAGLSGGGLSLSGVHNVIISNLTITRAKGTDAISVRHSRQVAIVGGDFSADRAHGKDYRSLIAVTDGSDFVTLSRNLFHDHARAVVIGAQDHDGSSDRDHLHVTLDHNDFFSLNDEAINVRFGVVHVYDNLLQNIREEAVQSRMQAQITAEGNAFVQVGAAFETHTSSRTDGSIMVGAGNTMDGAAIGSQWLNPPRDQPEPIPYRYARWPGASVAQNVPNVAGPH